VNLDDLISKLYDRSWTLDREAAAELEKLRDKLTRETSEEGLPWSRISSSVAEPRIDQLASLHPNILHALYAVTNEIVSACNRFPSFSSPHEGKAVIEEELDELWLHVKAETGRSGDARKEAVQVAAMALRYAIDLTESPPAVEPEASVPADTIEQARLDTRCNPSCGCGYCEGVDDMAAALKS
jgi:hypothetical protein